ncbi:hypothetical protein [Tenacibaculum sp. 190524A05c]|uniref:Cytochrome c domain-containing protein n=1 Tax=Tenacibaculum platacis TaxID=3137852 RepID=A0ABP1ELU5_9FLAO
MKMSSKLLVIPILLVAGILLASNLNNSPIYSPVTKDFKSANSEDNFNKMMDVLMSPRCINCHPNDNIPKQGDDSHPHYFGMSRGENNLGYQATKCTTCHQSENNNYSGVPGAPEWSLAPESMKWEGLTRKEIAESMLDPKRNGGRNHEELMHHLTEHELVLWAWEPGVRADGSQRNPPPVPVDEYIKAVKEWFEDGAKIPSNNN